MTHGNDWFKYIYTRIITSQRSLGHARDQTNIDLYSINIRLGFDVHYEVISEGEGVRVISELPLENI